MWIHPRSLFKTFLFVLFLVSSHLFRNRLFLHSSLIFILRHQTLKNFLFGSYFFRLVKWVIRSPFDSNRFWSSFSKYLVKHCFSCKFSKISMFILNESYTLLAIEMYILNFTPWLKFLIDYADHVFYWSLRIWRQCNITYKQCSTLLVKTSNPCMILFKRCMSRPPKYISQVILICKL